MDIDRLARWLEDRQGARSPASPSAEGPDDPRKKVDDLRKAVDDATSVLRALTFTYLAVWAYIVVAAGSVDDRQLLIGASIQLPLLGTGVGLTAFFWMAPALFLVLHGNVLLQLYLLARRLRRFDETARLLPEAEQAHARILLTPFPFVEWRAGRETARAMHAIFALADWALYIVLPLFLFLWVQFKFLPYQDEWITLLHLVLIAVDLLFLWLVWPRLNQAHGSWRAGIRELWRGSVSRWMLAAAPFVSLFCLLTGLAYWFDQRPSALIGIGPYVPERIASLLDYRWSRITVIGATLMKREPAPEIVAQFRRETERGREEEGERRAYLDPDLAEPLNLAGRSLRRAFLVGSKLWRSNLSGAQLQGAVLFGSQLQGANLREARLQGADLREAQLQGANLREAQLQGTDLREAQLQGANLREAQLQGADLFRSRLQGAVLGEAQLQGADLFGSQLQGANLWEARLQGADLREAQLQGADLQKAGIFLTTTDDKTSLSRADLRSVGAEPLTPEAQAELKASVEKAVANPRTRTLLFDRLKPVLAQPPPTWAPKILPKDKRRDVITDANAPEPIRVLTGNEALISPRDDRTYGQALAEELAQQACRLDDSQIVNLFKTRMNRNDVPFSDFAQHLTNGCPDLIAKLDPNTQKGLNKAITNASKAPAANTP